MGIFTFVLLSIHFSFGVNAEMKTPSKIGCDTLLATKSELALAEARNVWSPNAFTDPRNHDPSHFKYLVHAVDDIWTGFFADYLPDQISKNPKLLVSNPVVSASIVNENHLATWGPSGFILRVPSENFFAASERDIFTNNSIDRSDRDLHLESLFSLHGLKHPDDVLLSSKQGQYNEVVLVGSTAAGAIEVVGVFINNTHLISQRSSLRIQVLVETARQLGLPIIELN